MFAIAGVIETWLRNAGLPADCVKILAGAVCAVGIVTVAYIIKSVFDKGARRFLSTHAFYARQKEKIDCAIRRTSYFVFSWILCLLLPDSFQSLPAIAAPLARFLTVWSVVLLASSLSVAVTALRAVARIHANEGTLSSKTLAQTAKILIWFTAAIIAASTLMGKSPAFVLSGLGALTAVLMLIFRDSLLGLVAGIQVSQNDMVRVGDWITMPKYNADGNVIDIALTTVKVQNFDNTVTMIPSSALISDSFVNWRYMSISKGRRIKRPVWISVTSVRELSAEAKKSLVAEGLLEDSDNPVSNLAAFETWLRRMLKSDENITQDLTCMVRQTEAEDTGIPVEVYAFTKTRDWVEYERIQTEIFDRIFVTVPKFGLLVFQRTGDKGQH